MAIPIPSQRGIHSLAGHFLLAAISAALLALAFPRPGWGILAHAALAPLGVLAIRATSARRLAWTTFVVAYAWWLMRSSWLAAINPGGFAALAAYMALFTPAALLLLRFLHRRIHSAAVLTFPIAWISMEILSRHWNQGGFPWFALGHTQAASTQGGSPFLIAQVADVFGQHGVGFLVAMTNGLLVDIAQHVLPPLHPAEHGSAAPGPRPKLRTVHSAAVVWFAAMLAANLYGHYRVTEPLADAPTLRVAVVQTNVPQENKNSPDATSLARDWNDMVSLTVDAVLAEPRPDVVIWPETMVYAPLNREAVEFSREQGYRWHQYHEQVAEIASTARVYMVVGAGAELDWKNVPLADGRAVPWPRKRYNSAYVFRPDGSQDEQRYDKIHRVPFGEYVPWVDAFPSVKAKFIAWLTPYSFDYTISSGGSHTVFNLANSRGAFRVATPICFEDATPEVTRAMVYDPRGNKRADLLFNLTNDGWYPGTDQGPQHLQIASLRCIELRTPMARAVNTGVSGFIDSRGVIGGLVTVNGRHQLVPGSATADLRPDLRETLYGTLGEIPQNTLLILTALLLVLALFKHRPSRAA